MTWASKDRSAFQMSPSSSSHTTTRLLSQRASTASRGRNTGNIHVIVSDDCSTDQTQKVIKETISDMPPNVIVHRS